MNLTKASPAERAALVRMVSASAKLVVVIGRAISDTGLESTHPMAINDAADEFVGAVIAVQEAE